MEISKQDVINSYKSAYTNIGLTEYKNITETLLKDNGNGELVEIMNNYNETIKMLKDSNFNQKELLNLINAFEYYKQTYNKVKATLNK